MSTQNLTFDFNLAITEDPENHNLLHTSVIDSYSEKMAKYHSQIEDEKKNKTIRFQDLPYKKIDHLLKLKSDLSGQFDNLVVLGIGGSALGNTALLTALSHSYQQIKNPNGLRVFVTDNVDPDWFSDLFDVIDVDRTLFNVISKSGGTAETMSQFIYVWELLTKKYGAKAKNFMVATTDKKSGFLLDIANELGLQTLTVPEGVGGRFSVLSDVGLFSSLMAGIDIEKLLQGAGAMESRCQTIDLYQNPAYLNALTHFIYDTKLQKHMSVMMPYSSLLRNLSDWYCQLWGESLGKRYNLDKNEVFVGQTPIKAVGATDQHSQVQLYCEGPNNKIFTLLEVEKVKRDISFSNLFPTNEGTNYLGGHTMNQLIKAELHGTSIALADAGRPVVKVIFPEVNEFTVGQFIMLYELQTAIAGKLYHIDAYDQPGVEAGKKATFALMGRKGFEKEKERIEKSYTTNPKLVF